MQGGLLASRNALKPFKRPSATGDTPQSQSRPTKRPRISSVTTPFTSPSKITGSALSPSAELAQLEKRAHSLRQALEILEQDKIEKLEKLSEKWKRAGRRAAELLFDLVGSAGPPVPVAREDQGAASNLPWGWQRSDEEQAALDAAMRKRRYPAADVDAEDDVDFEEEDESLPSVGEFKRMVEARVKEGVEMGKSWQFLRDIALSEPEKKWNVGEMLRSRGVDPTLFGWQDQLESWDAED